MRRSEAPSLLTRVRTWTTRRELDEALASGADPSRTSELLLRAAQVTAPLALRRAAAELEGVVDSAEAYGPAPKPPVSLRTQAALDARAALLGLAQRLRDDDVVGARAAAMTSHLLHSTESPLYSDVPSQSVWDFARSASSAIDDARTPARSGDVPERVRQETSGHEPAFTAA